MDLLVKTVVLGLVFGLACLANFVCAAMNFALANYRFRRISNSKEHEALRACANYFLRNSKKVAPVTFMASKASFAAAVASAELMLFMQTWGYFGWWVELLLALLLVMLVSFFQYAFCELPAMVIAGRNPGRTLSRFCVPFAAVYALVLPVEFAARSLSRKIFGKNFLDGAAVFDYADVEIRLRADAEDAGSLPQYADKIIKNAMTLPGLDASDIMLPRSQVKYLDMELSPEENLKTAREAGHSRYPLCRGNLDECLGVIHIKDIFLKGGLDSNDGLLAIRHEIIRFKEDEPIVSVLPRLLKYELHMAFVEDEFGGIIGVLTLDDILEELVGEIKDEFDGAGVKAIAQTGGNEYKILGLAPLHKVEDFLGVDFGTDEASTFGGLITMFLGRFPKEKERMFFESQRLRVRVDKVGRKRILECTAWLENGQNES